MSQIDFTHDARAHSWVVSANGHADFPIQNLPFGIFSPPGGGPRGGVAIGEAILDVAKVAAFMDESVRPFALLAGQESLNALLGAGNDALRALRQAVFRLLADETNHMTVEPALHDRMSCTLHLPARIGDYTDFYTGIRHAENVGKLFRPDNPLLPNYKYVPIGYHGRSSSIRLSGTDVRRPHGQVKTADRDEPDFGPCERLDYELEMALWIGSGNTLGQPIPIASAGDHVAGLSLLNDWSARDVQAWEYQPLGPFLAKNFHSSISPWIVTAAALAPFRIAQHPRPQGDPTPLPYLMDEHNQRAGAYDVQMDVHILTPTMRSNGHAPHKLSSGSMAAMYWTAAQLVAHHSSNGCDLHPGDLFGTGTLSGDQPGSQGSLLELTQGGRSPIGLPGGETRTFLEDGDEIIFEAYATAPGFARIGFGKCCGRIVS